MSSTQHSTQTLPCVTKLYRHRQHRPFKIHKRHSRKIKSQQSVNVYTKIGSPLQIYPEGHNKVASASNANPHVHVTKLIKCQKPRKKSIATIRSVRVSNVRRSHGSVTETDTNKCSNDNWNNECNDDLQVVKENAITYEKHTQELSTMKTYRSATSPSQSSTMEPNATLFKSYDKFISSRMSFPDKGSDISKEKKRNKRRRFLGYYCCIYSPLSILLCVLGCLFVAIAIAALIVGLLIKFKQTPTTTTTTMITTATQIAISNTTTTTAALATVSTTIAAITTVSTVTTTATITTTAASIITTTTVALATTTTTAVASTTTTTTAATTTTTAIASTTLTKTTTTTMITTAVASTTTTTTAATTTTNTTATTMITTAVASTTITTTTTAATTTTTSTTIVSTILTETTTIASTTTTISTTKTTTTTITTTVSTTSTTATATTTTTTTTVSTTATATTTTTTTVSTTATATTTSTTIVSTTLTKTTTTTMITSTTTSPLVLTGNLLTNGDAETGPCAPDKSVVHPTGWNYNGSVTQIDYINTAITNLTLTTPAPSDRGQCLFYGGKDTYTSMWQTVSLTSYVNSSLIDAQTMKYNLSAWIGGMVDQDDNAVVTLNFTDQFNQTIGSGVSIGPVLAADRADTTSLLFRETNGLVPSGARFLTVLVTFILIQGSTNNAYVDDLGVYLYQ